MTGTIPDKPWNGARRAHLLGVNPDGDTGRYAPTAAASALQAWRLGIAGNRSNTARSRIVCIGDSTTAGYGAGSGGGMTGARPKAFPAYLAAALSGFGIGAHINTLFGTAALASAAAYALYDTRVSIGAGWTLAGLGSAGGDMWLNTTTTNSYAWTPPDSVDTFVIHYPQGSGLGTFTIDIDGGSATTINANGADVLLTQAITAAPGAHTLNVKRVSGSCYWWGIEAYTAATKNIGLVNLGCNGLVAANFTSDTWIGDVVGSWQSLAPSLSIITVGINDWGSGTNVAAFKVSVQTLIDTALEVGSCLLVIPYPSGTGLASIATQLTYIDALYELADTNAVPTIDLTDRFTTNADATAFDSGDGVHPGLLGYADIAQGIAALLAQA